MKSRMEKIKSRARDIRVDVNARKVKGLTENVNQLSEELQAVIDDFEVRLQVLEGTAEPSAATTKTPRKSKK